MGNSYKKGGHAKLQREFKVTVLSVNRFACASLYSMNGQHDEFQTDISCHKILTVCAATRDQPTVHKVSQPVPGIKIKSYVLVTFLNTTTFSGEIMQTKLYNVLNKDKGNDNLKKVRNTFHCW